MIIRTGLGVDAHQLCDGSPMHLAGLLFDSEPKGLQGHSDGDVACHAMCDALLSAGGLGDLGEVFGTSDPRWEGAAGTTLLAEVVRLITQAGYQISNVTVQIVGNHPKVSPRRKEAEEVLSKVIGAPVSVSATSTDGLGFLGRSEGLMAIASALLIAD